MNPKKNLIIIGIGETAQIAFEFFSDFSSYNIVAFSVSKQFTQVNIFNGLPVVSIEGLTEKFSPKDHDVFVAISFKNLNKDRSKLYSIVKSMNYHCASFFHPSTSVASSAKIGENCFIYDQVSIGPNVIIDDNTTVCSQVAISHRAHIHAHCYLAAGVTIGGFTSVGSHSFLGLNSTVCDKLSLSDHVLITANSCITKSLKQPNVFSGSPAVDTGIDAISYFRLSGGVL